MIKRIQSSKKSKLELYILNFLWSKECSLVEKWIEDKEYSLVKNFDKDEYFELLRCQL